MEKAVNEITIYKHNGSVRYVLNNKTQMCAIKSAEQKCELLGEDSVTLKVTSAARLECSIGDYIVVYGKAYTLNSSPECIKSGEREFETSFTFEGLQYKLLDAQYRNTDAGGNNQTASFSIVANLKLLMELLITNVNRVAGSLGESWQLGECPDDTEYKEFTYSSQNCLAVLQSACEEYKMEFDIEDKGEKRYVLNIRKQGSVFPLTFDYTKQSGVVKLQRKNVNSGGIVTRLYVEGSTQNISKSYKNGSERLRISDNTESYVEDVMAVAAFGVKEGSKQYDDIYPHRTGKVTGIVAGNVLQFVDEEMFDLNAKDADGNTKWLIDGTAAKVKFTGTSNLAGYEFELHKYDHNTHTFTLIKYEDKRGLQLPDGGSYKIDVGDEYVLLDIVMPQDPYVTDAEAKLKSKGLEELAELCQPKVEYELEISSISLEKKQGSSEAIVNVFMCGDYLHIKDADINVDKSIRIKSFTRDAYSDPYKYKLTLSDTMEVSIAQKLIEDTMRHEEIITLNQLTNTAKARANWRTTQELLNMVFDSDGYFDTANIKPASIETMMLSVGNRAGQFVIRDLLVTANAIASGKPNHNLLYVQATSAAALLTHYAIEEQDRTWQWLGGTQVYSLTNNGAYYIYAQCQKGGNLFSIVATQSKLPTDDRGYYYYFQIGILSSVFNGYRELTLTYGATRITGRCINCGKIESIDKSTYFDLDNAEIGGNIKFKSTDGSMRNVTELESGIAGAKDAIDGIATQVGEHSTAIDGLTTQVGEHGSSIEELYNNDELLQQGISEHGTSIDEMQSYINGQSDSIQELQQLTKELREQIDGTIEYWYGTEVPTDTNYPAIEWDWEHKKEHIGDIYTNTETGLEYRYKFLSDASMQNQRYLWQEIASSGVGTAMQLANQAIDVAGSKNHVYVTASISVPPPATYHVGDLWIMLDTLKMRYCITENDGVGYKASHWKQAGYTDDTAANNALGQLEDIADDGIVTPVEKLQMQSMWLELAADYAVVITQAEAAGVSHSSISAIYGLLGSILTPILADITTNSNIDRNTFNSAIRDYYKYRAVLLKNITDKKVTLYTTASSNVPPPTTYKKNDLWFTLNDYKVKLCVKDCAGAYQASDWKDAGYTDDTAANAAQSQLNALADDSKLTPSEKLTLQTELSNINADFVATSGKATAMGVDTSAFEQAFNALKTYANELMEDMSAVSDIDRTEYNSKFADYYTERTNIMLEISQKYVDELEIGQGNYIANGAYFAATTGWHWVADTQQLYADSVMGSVLRFGKSNTSRYFFLYTGFANKGDNIMLPDNKFMAGRKYTLAFWVKANKAMQIKLGVMEPAGYEQVAPWVDVIVGTEWQRICYTFTATDKSQEDTRLYLRGEHSITFSYLLLTKFVLVEGTKAPEWTDSSREYKAQMEANQQTLKAITDNYTQIDGGLILSTFLKLGALLSSGIYKESAGVKAMLNSKDEVAAYFGGTLAEAIAGNDDMTIIYHNGKLKSKNADITGRVNATDGKFNGSISLKMQSVSDAQTIRLSFDTGFNFAGCSYQQIGAQPYYIYQNIILPTDDEYEGVQCVIENTARVSQTYEDGDKTYIARCFKITTANNRAFRTGTDGGYNEYITELEVYGMGHAALHAIKVDGVIRWVLDNPTSFNMSSYAVNVLSSWRGVSSLGFIEFGSYKIDNYNKYLYTSQGVKTDNYLFATRDGTGVVKFEWEHPVIRMYFPIVTCVGHGYGWCTQKDNNGFTIQTADDSSNNDLNFELLIVGFLDTMY